MGWRPFLLAGAMLALFATSSSAQDQEPQRQVANALEGTLREIRSPLARYNFEANQRYGRLALDYRGANFSEACPRGGVLGGIVSLIGNNTRTAGLDMKIELVGTNGQPDQLILARTVFQVSKERFGFRPRCSGTADTLGGSTSMFALVGGEQQVRVTFVPWTEDTFREQLSTTLSTIPGGSMPGIAAAAAPYLAAANTLILSRFETHRRFKVSRDLRFNASPSAYGLEFELAPSSGAGMSPSILRVEMETTRSFFVDVGNGPVTQHPTAATVTSRGVQPNPAGGMISLGDNLRSLPLYRSWLDAATPAANGYNDACQAVVERIGALGFTESDQRLVLARIGQLHPRLGNVQDFYSQGGCTRQFYEAADVILPVIGPASWRTESRGNSNGNSGGNNGGGARDQTVSNNATPGATTPGAGANTQISNPGTTPGATTPSSGAATPAVFRSISATALKTAGTRFGRVARNPDAQERFDAAAEIFAPTVRFYDPGRAAFGSIDQTRIDTEEMATLVSGGLERLGCFLPYAPGVAPWPRVWAPETDRSLLPPALEMIAEPNTVGGAPLWVRLEFDTRVTDADAGPRITTVAVSKTFSAVAVQRFQTNFGESGCGGSWPLPTLPQAAAAPPQ